MSLREITPTTRPSSTTGRCRTPRVVITSAASGMLVPGVVVNGLAVIRWCTNMSTSQICALHLVGLRELLRISCQDYRSGFHDVCPGRDLQGDVGVLLHEQHRGAGLVDPHDDVEDLLHQQ